MTRTYAAVLAAVLLVLAGCSGAVPGGPSDDGDGTTGGTGTVNFYVSDEPNAIEDFEHLNVTITKVGFHRAKGADGTPESTATGTPESTVTGTPESTVTGTPESTVTGTPESTATETRESNGESEDRGDWKEFEVDSKTVDLTELQGNNATLVGQFQLDNGTYDKVFVYISDVNGTLKTGETVNVKLPSERLHINKRFTVGANESIDFVYDITVFKAGKSGKYILKPVVSESGTDVPINDVGESDDDDDRDDDREGTLEARFVGEVEPGANATVKVTRKGQPIENATVIVDGTEYTTDSDGTVTFPVPEDATELEVTVEYEDEEVELNREFEERGRSDDNGGNDDGQTTPTPTPTPTPTATPS